MIRKNFFHSWFLVFSVSGECLGEFSAQLQVPSSPVMYSLSITKILQSILQRFVSASNKWTWHHLCFTYKKIIMNDLHWCKWGKQLCNSVNGYRAVLWKQRSNSWKTEGPDNTDREELHCVQAHPASLCMLQNVALLLNCSVHVSQFDWLCSWEWMFGVLAMGFVYWLS